MIKEAIEKVLSLAEIRTTQIGDQVFTSSDLKRVSEAMTDTIQVRNLTGVVDYITSNFDDKFPVIVHIQSPTQVSVVTGFNRDLRRNALIEANALLPEIRFGYFYDIENFNILLQSCFVPTDVRAALLSIVGNVKDEKVVNFGDDGTSQQVTAKAGVATVEQVKLPNPVFLKPFRTFVEIEQPESAFVFRMKDGPSAALFEADGGEWKLRAIAGIKVYLDEHLSELIESGQVVIIG
ncbi:hypothetical protein OIN60_01410 [Paenibacillus sp. P96]|uniref:Phage protein n=1 Tax=Paenibacillus zeirhizosphaerae TaxID=2987519 RepID=A0ABT9FL43_9BACL|nr:hypothetical protein [Paenibacillus sp. P96]MDP4095449.1 hypothetical protein [Paenibacillus sp. P96]